MTRDPACDGGQKSDLMHLRRRVGCGGQKKKGERVERMHCEGGRLGTAENRTLRVLTNIVEGRSQTGCEFRMKKTVGQFGHQLNYEEEKKETGPQGKRDERAAKGRGNWKIGIEWIFIFFFLLFLWKLCKLCLLRRTYIATSSHIC